MLWGHSWGRSGQRRFSESRESRGGEHPSGSAWSELWVSGSGLTAARLGSVVCVRSSSLVRLCLKATLMSSMEAHWETQQSREDARIQSLPVTSTTRHQERRGVHLQTDSNNSTPVSCGTFNTGSDQRLFTLHQTSESQGPASESWWACSCPIFW